MRLPIIGLITGLTVWMVITSCERIKPEPPRQTSLDSSLVPPLSTITIPVEYEVSQLEQMVNTRINGTILNEDFRINDKDDSLFIIIEKSSRIFLSWRNPKLFYSVPVRVSGKFLKHVGSLKIKNSQPLEMEMVLHMTTELAIGNNWQLKTKTTLDEIKWIKDPKLRLVIVKVNLRKKVEEAINKNKEKLTAKLDQIIPTMLNTRKVVSKLWMDIQKPIRINKKEKEVWLKAHGHRISASLRDSKPDIISLNVQLQATVETFMDGYDVQPSNDSLPDYEPAQNKHDSITMFILAHVPFSQAEDLLNEALSGKVLSSQGYSTTIKHLNLYGTDSALCLAVKVKGDVDGKIFLTARPGYDTLSSTFYAKKFNYDIDTENALVNSADWLLRDEALEVVKKKLRINVQPIIDTLPLLIMKGIERGKTGEKIDVTINSLSIKPVRQLITNREYQVLFFASGRARIDLEQKLFSRKKKRPVKK